MKLFDYIKQLFSHREYKEESIPTYKDDSEEQETYYVPPFEESVIDKSETNSDESSSTSTNNIDSIRGEEDIADNTTDSFSKTDNNSKNEISNNEETDRVVQLQQNVISTIEEFDSYLSRIENEDAKELITLFQHRLIESLVESGLDRIDDDKYFNCLRHVVVPFSIVPEGTPIKEIKRNGIIHGNRVLLKAQVIV